MKKLLLIIVALSVVIFCNAQKPAQRRNYSFENMSFDQKGITFTIDPRIELWNVIGIVLGNPTINPARLTYKEEVISKFSKYRNHPVMDLLFNTAKNGWDMSAPFQYFLHFDKSLSFDPVGLDASFIEMSGGKDNLIKLAKEVKDFAEVSGFYSFYNDHIGFYRLILDNTKYNFSGFDEKRRIEDFYGQKKNSYTVILNLLEGSGNFGVNVKNGGKENLNAVICCYSTNGSIPSFAPDFEFYNLIYHEFSHSYCNPLVYANAGIVNTYQHLFEPIKKSLSGQGYNNWLTAVHEHLVRVSAVLLAEQKFGNEVSNLKFYTNEIGKRFIYVKALREKLRDYQNNRNKYKTYADFFPELLKVFSGITPSDIKKLQAEVEQVRLPDVENIPIPAKAQWDSTMIFIVSTHENSVTGNDSVRHYAEAFRNRIHIGIRIVNDDDVTDSDLKNNDCIAFGTINGNSFIKKNISRLPVIIKNDYLVFKDVIYGSNFKIVTSWLNPVNPQKQMIFYTGQKAEDIRDYQYIPYKDGNNYWVGRNSVTICKGNFDRFMKIWTAN